MKKYLLLLESILFFITFSYSQINGKIIAPSFSTGSQLVGASYDANSNSFVLTNRSSYKLEIVSIFPNGINAVSAELHNNFQPGESIKIPGNKSLVNSVRAYRCIVYKAVDFNKDNNDQGCELMNLQAKMGREVCQAINGSNACYSDAASVLTENNWCNSADKASEESNNATSSNAVIPNSLGTTSASDAVGNAIGLTIDLINQGKRKKWSREYLEKANQFQSSYGITIDALENAVETNDIDAMTQMIRKGFDINVNIINQKLTLLCFAADQNKIDIVKLLLEAGADINRGSLSNPDTYGGLTPLHCAAFNGNIELIKLLYNKGANINAQMDVCRITPLWQAVVKNRLDAIRHLLSIGADRTLTVKWDSGSNFRINWTPFQYAKKFGLGNAADILVY